MTTAPSTMSQSDIPNRRIAPRRRRRACRTACICLAGALLALPAQAGASVVLGQLPPGAPSPGCAPNADYLEPSVTGGNLYIAKEAGTITSWSTASLSAGTSLTFKVFRRTSDPDVFQAIEHAPTHKLGAGVNTVPVNLPVKSGDMIGLNSGSFDTCTFAQAGDIVLTRPGSLSDGSSGTFTDQSDQRLNLSAILVPDNGFTVAGIARDRRLGTATVTLSLPNPGTVTMADRGVKRGNSTKTIAVPGTLSFHVAAAGKLKRKLAKKGKVLLQPSFTYTPPSGDPNTQVISLKLKKRRQKAALS